MIKTRIATAIIGLPIIFFFLKISPFFWSCFCCVISLLVCKEILDVFSHLSKFHRISVYINTIFLYGLKWEIFTKMGIKSTPIVVLILPMAILLLSCGMMEIFQKDFSNTMQRLCVPLFSFIYASLFLSLMVDLLLEDLSPFKGVNTNVYAEELSTKGMWYVIYTLTGAWMCDTGAFFGGKYWGGKITSFRCSPSKTWGGLFSGVGISLIGMFLLRKIVLMNEPDLTQGGFFDPKNTIFFLMTSLSISLLSIIGDLVESAIKRSQEKKDSGNCIPGHGGIFDVVDSCILTCVFFYIVLQLYNFA